MGRKEHVEEGLAEIHATKKEKKDAVVQEEKEGDIRIKQEREENFYNYQNLLTQYGDVWNRIKRLERGYKTALTDTEVGTAIRVLDEERHNVHLKMLETAAKIGKSKGEVTADILNQEGNLAEFGLPEFALYQPDKNERFIEEPDNALAKEYFKSRRTLIDKNKYSYLMFAIGDRTIGNEESPRPKIPRLYFDLRHKKELELADELHLAAFRFNDEFAHLCDQTIYCVRVPDDQLEKVAVFINSQQERFRIREDFFSEQEKKEAVEKFKQAIKEWLDFVEMSDTYSIKKEYLLELLTYMQRTGSSEEISLTKEFLDNYKEELDDDDVEK